MTATDELRALLDDAGVEWDKGAFPNEARTYWRDVVARPWNEQRLYVTALLTPAQAIAATLGRGTCKRLWTGSEMICSECAHQLNDPTANFCPSCGRRVIDAGEVDG